MAFNDNMPDTPIFILQIFLAISFVAFTFIARNLKVSGVLLLSTIFQLICCIVLRIFFVEYYDNSLGLSPIDSQLYHDIATVTSKTDFKGFISYLDHLDFSFSDYGFPIIQRLVYMLFGDFGIHAMIFINILFHIATTYLIYQLSLLVTKDYQKSKIVIIFWGFNVCSTWLSVSGLKELTFLFFIVMTMYYMYRFYESKSIVDLLLMCLGIVLIWLFRYYLSIFFIMIFLAKMSMSEAIYKRLYPLCIILVSVFILTALMYLTAIMPELAFVSGGQEARLGSSSLVMKFIYGALTFLAPFPNIVNAEAYQNMFFVCFSLSKVAISGFFLFQMYKILKNKYDFLYPILSFIILDILLCIVTGFYSNYRYLFCMLPFYVILSVMGVESLSKSKNFKLYSYVFFLFVMLVILINNIK